MFHYIAVERLRYLLFSLSVSLVLLSCFPPPLLSCLLFLFFWLSLLPPLFFLVLAGRLGGFLQIGTQMNYASKARESRELRLDICVCQALSLCYSYVGTRLELQKGKGCSSLFVYFYPFHQLSFAANLCMSGWCGCHSPTCSERPLIFESLTRLLYLFIYL